MHFTFRVVIFCKLRNVDFIATRAQKHIDQLLFNQLCLQEGANIEAEDKTGRTPLLLAAHSGASECVNLLLERGADARHRDNEGRNFVQLAILNRKTLEILDRLTQKGARQTLCIFFMRSIE